MAVFGLYCLPVLSKPGPSAGVSTTSAHVNELSLSTGLGALGLSACWLSELFSKAITGTSAAGCLPVSVAIHMSAGSAAEQLVLSFSQSVKHPFCSHLGLITVWLAQSESEPSITSNTHQNLGGIHRLLAQVYSVQLGSWKWAEHTSEVEGEVPTPRSGHTAVALPDGRHLALFGGGDADRDLFYSSVSVLDTATWRWSTPKIQVSPRLLACPPGA